MRYDVIIAGASFAGLAAAQALRGHGVLLVDQRAPGEHQTSACATPLSTVRAVGGHEAILEVHRALVLHLGNQEISFELADPYVTFDYHTLCQSMLTRAGAKVIIARAAGCDDGQVATDRGSLRGRFVVDATGWGAALSGRGSAARWPRTFGCGLETELPVRLDMMPGLHFYCPNKAPLGRGRLGWAYAWAFPCGQSVRLGVVRFGHHQTGLRAELESFAGGFGLRVGRLHGGVLSFGYREPVAGDLFVIGDAAGQCLPLTGEGIRTAIFHGLHCGRAIRGALAGEFGPEEARGFYRELVLSRRHAHRYLSAMQRLAAWLPSRGLAAVARAADQLQLDNRLMDKYLRDSGWFVEHSWLPIPAHA